VARYAGISWEVIQTALPDFVGASRRFEVRGKVNNITFIDDYAHHPSEILATLASAKLQRQTRVIAVFQPHRFSRTQKFLSEFANAFGDADLVVVTEIYAAGEENATNLTGFQVAAAIANAHGSVEYQPSLADVQSFLSQDLQPGDLVVFLGAGNLNQIISPTIAQISNPVN
jgi:UDP-N-acetylmuramate--alanine ligase